MLTIDIRDLIDKYTYTKSQVLNFMKNDKLLVLSNLSELDNIKHKFNDESSYIFNLRRSLGLSMLNYEKNYKNFKNLEYNDNDKFLLIKDMVFEKVSNIFKASDFYNSLSIIALNEICLNEYNKGLFEYLLDYSTYSCEINRLIKLYEEYLGNQDNIYTIKIFKDSKFKNRVYPKKIKVTKLLREYYLGVDSELLLEDNKVKKINDDILSETDKYLICFSKEDIKLMLSIIKEHGLKTLNDKINKSYKRIRFLEDEIKREEKKIEELSDKSIYLEEELNYVLGL